jgi:DNA polymerase III delta prime subunit
MSRPTTLRLRRIRYWRLALGDDEAQWAAWRAGSFVAMAWDELGDLRRLSRREFERRRDAILARFDERTKASAELVWRFARHIGEGDRIVVCRGAGDVVGLATVTGPYFFVPDVFKGHCLPVDWNDLRVRQVSFPNWRRPLVELSPSQFDTVVDAPAVAVPLTGLESYMERAEPLRLAESAARYEVTTPERPPSDPNGVEVAGPESGSQTPAVYPDLPTLAAELAYPTAIVEGWLRALARKGQLILSGPPGVGKTFTARALARHLAEAGDGFFELVQFHAAYSYEDFVQGLRPHNQPGGQLAFRMEAGHFVDFCRRAAHRQGECVLVVDEINRANVARVFGELLYLLEYRDESIRLAGGERPFQIPANVRLIGTMNSADRSIAMVDFALRRRFAFVELTPNSAILRDFHAKRATGFAVEPLINLVEQVNQAIGDPAYALGYSYFLRTDLAATLFEIWQMEVEPYLAEYFFDQPERLNEFRWARVCSKLMHGAEVG